MLVAISFHNTVEQRMHNEDDVEKMNVLTNAGTLGRLITKVPFSYLQEFWLYGVDVSLLPSPPSGGDCLQFWGFVFMYREDGKACKISKTHR